LHAKLFATRRGRRFGTHESESALFGSRLIEWFQSLCRRWKGKAVINGRNHCIEVPVEPSSLGRLKCKRAAEYCTAEQASSGTRRGFAQPMPRPLRKSGANTIEQFTLEVSEA